MDREFIGGVNVLLVGLGKWSSNYSSSIKNNKSCILSSHLGARDLIQKLDLDKKFFLKILENQEIDIVILSTKPSYQKRILGSLDGFQGQIILEKPLINNLDAELVEMKRCKSRGFCCGAGGAQMFKEPEKGQKDVNIERTEEALETQPDFIATGCPFCNTMMTDGIKNKEKDVKVLDLAEMIATAKDL